MARFSRNGKRGVSRYMISVIVLAVLLIGGVLLLKDTDIDRTEVDKPIAVETGDFKADDAETDDKNAEETSVVTPPITAEPSDVAPTTGSTSDDLAAAGPEDFTAVLISMLVAGGTVYAAWCYAKSRSLVKAKLLSQ